MKFKNKGRKIYKTKEKNYYGKTPFGKFMSGALTVLLLGGLGFLGYSVAEPLVNYTKKKGDSSVVTTTENPSESATEEYFATAPEINVSQNTNLEVYNGVALTVNDIINIDKLRTALERLKGNTSCEYVSVPIKASGGDIYYASVINEAKMSGAVKSNITLAEITSEIRTAGFKPVAEICVLEDHVLPGTYAEMSYTTADDGSRWIDANSEYWISPFSERSVEYLGEISDEIAAADFEKAICTDIAFPPFKPSDLQFFGVEVTGSDNYLALTSLANMLYSRLMAGGTPMLLEVSAADILREKCDIIQPMLLDVNTLVLNINLEELGNSVSVGGAVYEFAGTPAENASKLLGLVEYKLEGYNCVVRITKGNLSEADLAAVKSAIAGNGYTSFIIG